MHLIDIERLKDIAISAGERILEIYQRTDFSAITESKADHSPLTLADKASHEYIVSHLAMIYPEIPIFSEEGRQIPYAERKDWNWFWLVDPLDGTKEFLKRNGEFTVNIALVERQTVILGVVYAPVLGTLYYGSGQEGAFKQERGKAAEAIRVNGKTGQRIAVGSRSHGSEEEAQALKQYDVVEQIAIGSSLKFCLIAEGKADVYYRHGPTMEWDTAAGQAVVEAAGGKVLDINGQKCIYNKPSPLNSSFVCTGF